MARPRTPDEVKELREFLARKRKIDLGNLFIVLQMTVEALATRYRWHSRARPHIRNPNSSALGRQTHLENVLQHCFKTAFLAALMVEVERRAGGRRLDAGRLTLAGLLHDIPELFKGDNFYFRKTGRHERVEQRAFRDLIKGFGEEVREFLLAVYMITQPRAHAPRRKWTREQRFFKLVELIGYLKRALAECRAGNMHFAQVLVNHWGNVFPHQVLAYEREFSATLSFWFPPRVRAEIEKFMRLVPRDMSAT